MLVGFVRELICDAKKFRISFKIKIYNNPEETDLDKYDHVFVVELDRTYKWQDWNVLKCDFA